MKPCLDYLLLTLCLCFLLLFHCSPVLSQSYTPPQNVTVTMYALEIDGSIVPTPSPECVVNTDMRFGCTAYPDVLSYPYLENPTTVSIEEDYLPDVVSKEMSPSYHNAALQSQAVAARTYAYCHIDQTYGNCNRGIPINNSNAFQVFIPRYFDLFDSAAQQRILAALANQAYLTDASDNQGPIFAEFSTDAYLTTAAGDCDYLQAIFDPISYDPAIPDIIAITGAHQRGMSQNGASRWGYGSSSRLGSATPWSVAWNDYRQILAHYYAHIDTRNANGDLLSPDYRWNMLTMKSPNSVPPGHIRMAKVWVQNTGTQSWYGETLTQFPIGLSYRIYLSGLCVTNCDASRRTMLASDAEIQPGETYTFTVPVFAPDDALIRCDYTLQ